MNRSNIVLTGWLLVFLHSPMWSAEPYKPVFTDPLDEPWRFRAFPELEGLGATCLTEDADENMWFGVTDGVIRFDGIEWQLFTSKNGLLPGPVRALHTTTDGILYAGSDYGLSRFVDEHWEPVFPVANEPRTVVKNITSDSDGNVWAASSWGLLSVSKNSHVLYTSAELGNQIRQYAPRLAVVHMPDEAMLKVPYGIGIGAILTDGATDQSIVKHPPVTIHALAQNGPAAKAGLRVGDQLLNVNRFGDLDDLAESMTLTVQREGTPEPFEASVVPAHVDDTAPTFDTYSLAADSDGSLWVGLYSGEVVHLTFAEANKDQIVSTHLFTAQNLSIGFGPRILIRANGDIWVVNEFRDSPVQKFDGETWSPVTGFEDGKTIPQ